MKKVGIVICNYNKEDAVACCIQSILESEFQDFDLYVVDNGSTDQSVKRIKESFAQQVVLLENKENMGGSGGFNTGLRYAYAKGYPYLMCVDNDALLDSRAVGALYGFLETHKETGMAASKVYHMEAPDYVQQFGQVIDFEHFCTEVNYLNAYEDGTMPEYLYVDSVAACSLMVRREVIEQIGFMPEENFLYWDDTEWCFLCNRAGYKVASVGASVALHAMGAKRELENTFPTYYAWRNWIVFFAKYTSEERLEAMAESFLASMFEIVYEGLCKGEDSQVRTVMLAYDDAIHGVRGKAGRNRIFAIPQEKPWLKEFFSKHPCVYLEENEFEKQAARIREIVEKMGLSVEWRMSAGPGVTTVSLCESIFQIEDMRLTKVYLDLSDCLFATEEDMLNVINYNYSKRSFVYGHKPVFLENIKTLRDKLKSDVEG